MKIQNLAIIFLVISIPLIVMLSYYLSLQQKTLNLQTEYDTKLAEATKEGIKAFEVNTVDWSEWVSDVSSQKTRNNVQAVINTFITSLSNNLHISGTAKEFMLNYIPAIVMTMYDGYYVYAPTYTPVVANNADGVQLFYDTTSGGSNKITLSDEGEILYEAAEDGKTYYYTYTNDFMETETQEYSNLTTDMKKAKMEHRNILNNKISYSGRYATSTNETNVLINYTLDNRIYVYGTVNNETINKNGYLVYFDDNNVLPRITVDADAKNESNIHILESVGNTVYSKKMEDSSSRRTEIEPETLTEQILYKKELDEKYRLETFKYIYDIQNEKLYYDEEVENFFTLNEDKTQNFIPNSLDIKAGKDKCRYKSVSVLLGNGETTEFKKIYQVLNGKDKGKWYINIKEDSEEAKLAGIEEIDTEITGINKTKLGLVYTGDVQGICKDYSAINYYVEAYAFTNWVKQNLGNKNLKQLTVNFDETNNQYQAVRNDIEEGNIFNISLDNDPEKKLSDFVQHKEKLMKESITSNLVLSLSNYNANGKYDFKLPMLTDSDWNQIFSNISLLTFFQGVPIGLKTYNNYAIATSTTNREYVDPGELYFSGPDSNYHRVYCEKCGNEEYIGYRSVEYVQREYTATLADGTSSITYYYQHDNNNDPNSETACYYCTVNKSNYEQSKDLDTLYKQAKSYNEALARERYYQKQAIGGRIGITITYHPTYEIGGEITGIYNIPDPQEADIGVATKILGNNPTPTITTNDQFVKYVFVGWAETPNSTTIKYMPGDSQAFFEDVDLYAVWRISLSELDWTRDYKWSAPEYWDGGDHNVRDGSISNIRITESTEGAKVEMTGNSVNQGKGATWATFKSEFISIQEFQFTYHVNKGDSFNAVGFMFNVIDQGDYLEGYMFSINFTGEPEEEAGDTGAIFKFEYYKNSNTKNIESLTLVGSAFHINVTADRYSTTSGSLSIKVLDNGYLVTGTEMSGSAFIPVDNPQPDTFGFMSDHYSHSCNQIGYYKIDNIKIIAVRNK